MDLDSEDPPRLTLADLLLIILYFVILIFTVGLIDRNYMCTDSTCHLLQGKTGTDYLQELFGQGVWPVAFLFASLLSLILTPIVCFSYRFRSPNPSHVLKQGLLILIISFLTLYIWLSFLVYHYVTPLTQIALKSA